MPQSLLTAVSTYIEAGGGGEGLFPTPVDSVHILRSFHERMPMRQIYRPSLCLIVQGAKEIMFGEDRLQYGPMECLVVSMEIPASGRIVSASRQEPYIGVTIDFDVAMIAEVMEQMDTAPEVPAGAAPCLFVAKLDAPLADCILRLLRMFERPGSIPVLYPSLMREICYWLLSSEHGGELRRLALPETQTERVARAVYHLRTNFSRTLRIEELAETARMSPTSFHQHFKAMTSMTPLQYQKQLRLLEARRVMVTDAVNVADAAYQVGYESASQFSREYSRMFGIAPKQDVMNLLRQYSDYTGRKVQTA